MEQIFISHTHTDKPLAEALSELIQQLFGGRVRARFSSAESLREGIAPGENWVEWIHRQVSQSRVALVLLTPDSIQKPWILWEAGAVEGAALAAGGEHRRRVKPLMYNLSQQDVPSPFESVQVLRGDRYPDLRRLVADLLSAYSSLLDDQEKFELGGKAKDFIDPYLRKVEQHLLKAPLLPTEAAVQEWCIRLDELREGKRFSETSHLHAWLTVAFGRQDKEEERRNPIDLRIHRRLGQLYLDSGRHDRAAEQFELARTLSPRDIFILRALGQAYLGLRAHDRAKEVIDQIREFDPKAFEHNTECAALLGRWHREQENWPEAASVYQAALQANPDSYYLADLLGQARLQMDDRAGAKVAYGQALAILRKLNERNVWTYATAASAAIVTEREDEVIEYLARIHELGPTNEQLNSIEKGLRRIQEAMGLDGALFGRWQSVLRGADAEEALAVTA